jgi:two-component system, LytTR family, response regulator LytT
MKILIAEDEAIIAESLYQVLSDLGYSPLEPSYDSDEAIANIDAQLPSLALVDIHIGEQFSGFKVASKLNQKSIPFIFVTALYDKETVKKATEFNPSAYLVKPFNKENLFTTIELAIANNKPKHDNKTNTAKQIFVKDGANEISISPNDITYIESAGAYINIFMRSGKRHLTKSSLQEFLVQHNINTLAQVHKSYIINIAHIKAIKYDEVLVHETMIPIGRAYRNNLRDKLNVG